MRKSLEGNEKLFCEWNRALLVHVFFIHIWPELNSVFFFGERKRSGGDFHYRLQKLQKRDGEK